MKRSLTLLLACTALSACSLVPDYVRPDVQTPNNWEQGAGSADAQQFNATWWKQFGSTELDALEEQALANNLDVESALARLEQSRAQARIAGANAFPDVDLAGSASHSDSSTSQSDDAFRATAGIAYEVDLFGRKRAVRDAASARLDASIYDADAVRLMVAGDVAQAYFEILTLQERQRIAEKNLSRAGEVLKIIDAQFNEGRTSGLEVSQQRSDLATTRAQLAALRNQLTITRNRLAILLGKAPEGFITTGVGFDTITMPVIQLALPARVIEQRPDIRSAEATLKAANADIGAARAAFYPSLTLSADLSVLADPSAAAGSLAASILQPIFKGGELKASLQLSEARQREIAAGYRASVLTAFGEIENSLSGLKTASERHQHFATAAEEAGIAYGIATDRFEAGAIDFQTLLDTQRTELQANDSFYQAKLEALRAAIDLYRAMGGGWDAKP